MSRDQKASRGSSVRVGPLRWAAHDGALTSREALTPGVLLANAVLITFFVGLLAVALYLFLAGLDETARYGPLHRDGPLGAGRDVSAGAALGVGLIAVPALAFGVVAVALGLRRHPLTLRPDGLDLRVKDKWSGRVPVQLTWDDVADVVYRPASPGRSGDPTTRNRTELVLRQGVRAEHPRVGVVATDEVVTVDPRQVAAVLHHFCHHPEERALLGSPDGLRTARQLATEARARAEDPGTRPPHGR